MKSNCANGAVPDAAPAAVAVICIGHFRNIICFEMKPCYPAVIGAENPAAVPAAAAYSQLRQIYVLTFMKYHVDRSLPSGFGDYVNRLRGRYSPAQIIAHNMFREIPDRDTGFMGHIKRTWFIYHFPPLTAEAVAHGNGIPFAVLLNE